MSRTDIKIAFFLLIFINDGIIHCNILNVKYLKISDNINNYVPDNINNYVNMQPEFTNRWP